MRLNMFSVLFFKESLSKLQSWFSGAPFFQNEKSSGKSFLQLIWLLSFFFLSITSSSVAQELWGTTPYGGTGGNYDGTIFQYSTGPNIHTIKHNFEQTTGRSGGSPLLQASNGKLYGTTIYGGLNNVGVIFEYNLSTGVYTNLFDFSDSNGTFPNGGLMQARNGKLYGVTLSGGIYDGGIIFEYEIITNTFQVLNNFGTEDGYSPNSSLVEVDSGKFYGTTSQGGANNYGTIYEINILNDTITILYDGSTSTGHSARSLTLASNGNLYGLVDYFGPDTSWGAIFEYNFTTETYTNKYHFQKPSGWKPVSITAMSDEYLYGVTQDGGANNGGVIFVYDYTFNAYANIYDFVKNATGYNPRGGLLQSSNGKMYGTTHRGGLFDNGVIFEFDRTGNTYTKKIDFDNVTGFPPEGDNLIEVFPVEISGPWTLTVSGINGSVTKNPNLALYPDSSSVVLTANPNVGYYFVGWSGSLSGTENPATIMMSSNKNVTANFAIYSYPLSVSGDHGVVTKEPNQEVYDYGSEVQISQMPDRGYIFTGWSGDFPPGDSISNPLHIIMNGAKVIQANYEPDPAFQTLYRTASYVDWASAKDGKGALKSIKRKADKIFFKFNLTVAMASTILFLEFPADASGAIMWGKSKSDTLTTFSTTKKKFRDTLEAVTAGDTIQIEGIAKAGKKISVKYAWGTAKPVTLKADSIFKVNRTGLPKPNLHNVGEELFPKGFGQSNAYFTNGLLIGVPQGEKKAQSVIHPKYTDVQKSLVKVKKDSLILHAQVGRCFDSLGLEGQKKKPFDKQQKSLPPDKMSNPMFAELLTLKLNIAASATEKFPVGFGELTFNDPALSLHPFNGKTLREVALIADTMISCQPALSVSGEVLSDVFDVLKRSNEAFADNVIDTVSFGSKTKLTGVKSLLEVDFLQPTPGIEPRIVQSFDVASDNEMPEQFELYQNYPNPFNPSTVIRYSSSVTSIVTLKVFNMLGQEIATLLNHEEMEEGEYELPFEAINLPSGVYFYRINVEPVNEDGTKQSFTDVKRMILVK